MAAAPSEAAAAPAPPQAAEQAPAEMPADGASAEGAEEEEGMLPDPVAEPTGIIGLGAKLIRAKTSELAESERVKKGLDFVKDKTQQVKEKVESSEKVQKGVEYVKTKTAEIKESERVQKGVEFAKEKAQVAAEKTKLAAEAVKEKTKGLREGAGSVWQKGRGSIQRARAKVSNVQWKGSARDTLDIAAREEQWKGIKVQGAEELAVPARTEHTCCYHVSKGSTLRWTFRVKEHDIGFGLRMRVQEWGGSREDEVLPIERYDSEDTISGSWVADEDRTMVLVFDNRYSKLRGKTVAYYTGTEKPPVYVETPCAEEPTAEAEQEPPAAAVETAQETPAPPAPRALV